MKGKVIFKLKCVAIPVVVDLLLRPGAQYAAPKTGCNVAIPVVVDLLLRQKQKQKNDDLF